MDFSVGSSGNVGVVLLSRALFIHMLATKFSGMNSTGGCAQFARTLDEDL